MKSIRAYFGGLGTETNSFSVIPTGASAFVRSTPAQRERWQQMLQPFVERDIETVGNFWAFAAPSSPVTAAAYTMLREELLREIEGALPLTFIALTMHGAMIAQGEDDCEGDILERVRTLAGPETIIGATLDPHCHLTSRMVRASNLLLAYKEYPHFDSDDREDELIIKLLELHDRKWRPKAAIFDCRTISAYFTDEQPMRAFVDSIYAREGRDGVFSISIAHGFPWGDVQAIGTKVLVYAESEDGAKRVARELGDWLIEHRGQTFARPIPFDTAIEAALAGEGLAVIADSADNTGGGAAGDSTFLLRALLDKQTCNVAFGTIWDPVSVAFAMQAGKGARIQLRVGGKVSVASGDPIDLEGLVGTLETEYEEYGDVAVIELPGNVHLVLNSSRRQVVAPAFFEGLGISLATKRIVVVKSNHHFNFGFAPIAARVVYASSPGALSMDFANVPYRFASRPIWPVDAVAEGCEQEI